MRCQYCCWRYTHPGCMWDRWALSLRPRGHVPPFFPQACPQGAECRGAPGQAGPHLCCPTLWSAHSPLPLSQVLSPSFVCKLIPWGPTVGLGMVGGLSPHLELEDWLSHSHPHSGHLADLDSTVTPLGGRDLVSLGRTPVHLAVAWKLSV